MSKRADKEGWSTKVTYLGKGLYGCRVFHNGKLHSEGTAKSKAEAAEVLRELLRWVDKMGCDSSMADASRTRNFTK